MAIAPFPHEYSVTLANRQLSCANAPPIAIGPPEQFGGPGDVWSPEHLLVAAALSCLETTFDAYCQREGLVVRDWRAKATAVLGKANHGPEFRVIEIDVELVTRPGDEARGRAVLANAERNCIISHALAAPVRVIAHVTSSSDAA